MAFWLILFKAIKIKLAVSRLKRAKLNAYRKSKGLPPTYPWYEAIPRFIYRAGKYIFLRAFCWCLIIKGKNQSLSIWESLWTSGTLSNSIMKSFGGFVCGLLFTHLITIFLIFQLKVSPYLATYGTMFFGLFLTLSLAFSETTRLFVFLTVPQFFTRKGRTAILAYAIILAVSGPGKNTTQNMEILTESIICTQEMAKNATAGLVRLVKDPMTAIGKAMKSVVDTVLEAANKIKSGLMKLMKVITSMVNTILFAFDWLKKIVEICNNKVGTPFDRCWKSFDEAIEDCHYQLGSILSWMCNVVDLFQHICYVTKVVDLLCWLPSLVKDVVFKPIKKLLKNFMESVKTFFDVRIPLPTYKFDHSLTPSKKFKEIIHDMKAEVTGELQWLLDYFDWMDFLVSIFLFLALYKAIIYRHRFLNMDRHDNYYITKGLVKLDWSRKRLGKQYIFPLAYRESQQFVQTYSFRMLKDERKKLRNSLIMVTLGATQILNYMLLDFGLFLFLELIRRHGAIRVDTRNLLGYNIKITGTGFMADMYRAILKALSPIGGLLPVFDTTPCLPIPSIPDYIRYAILICLILFCYLATLTEPYTLRLRHIICGMYYPERKGHRDRWLYTHILNRRGSFASYARAQVKARLIGDKQVFRISLMDRLSHTIPGFRFIVAYFSTKKKQCFLCGRKGDLDDFENFYQCPICHTVYCMECYNEMGKKCPAHSNAFDSSAEFSEEQPSDSSDDEKPKPLKIVSKLSNKSVKAVMPPGHSEDEPSRKIQKDRIRKIDEETDKSNLSSFSESEDDRKALLKSKVVKPRIISPSVFSTNIKSSGGTDTTTSKILQTVLPSIQGGAVKMKRLGSNFKDILKGKSKESERSKILSKSQKQLEHKMSSIKDVFSTRKNKMAQRKVTSDKSNRSTSPSPSPKSRRVVISEGGESKPRHTVNSTRDEVNFENKSLLTKRPKSETINKTVGNKVNQSYSVPTITSRPSSKYVQKLDSSTAIEDIGGENLSMSERKTEIMSLLRSEKKLVTVTNHEEVSQTTVRPILPVRRQPEVKLKPSAKSKSEVNLLPSSAHISKSSTNDPNLKPTKVNFSTQPVKTGRSAPVLHSTSTFHIKPEPASDSARKYKSETLVHFDSDIQSETDQSGKTFVSSQLRVPKSYDGLSPFINPEIPLDTNASEKSYLPLAISKAKSSALLKTVQEYSKPLTQSRSEIHVKPIIVGVKSSEPKFHSTTEVHLKSIASSNQAESPNEGPEPWAPPPPPPLPPAGFLLKSKMQINPVPHMPASKKANIFSQTYSVSDRKEISGLATASKSDNKINFEAPTQKLRNTSEELFHPYQPQNLVESEVDQMVQAQHQRPMINESRANIHQFPERRHEIILKSKVDEPQQTKTFEFDSLENTRRLFNGNTSSLPENQDGSNFRVYSPQNSESETFLTPRDQIYSTSVQTKTRVSGGTTEQPFLETIPEDPTRLPGFVGLSSDRSQLDDSTSCRTSCSSHTLRKSSLISKRSSRFRCNQHYSPRKHVRFSNNGPCVNEAQFDSDKAQISTGADDSRADDFTDSSNRDVDPIYCCESAKTDLNVYDEEMDALDKDGICHHHQSADDEVYDMYDNVVSEIESICSQHSSEMTTSDETEDSEVDVVTDTNAVVSDSSNIKSQICCRSHINERTSAEVPVGDQFTCNPVQNWVHRSTAQLRSRNVDPALTARVQQLDSFYLGMPYPPHYNIYKSERK